MYDDREVDISRKYLLDILSIIEGPYVLVGGWGVYLNVNYNYRQDTGREYLGSRDIDLGIKVQEDFHEERDPLLKIIKLLKDKYDFRPLAFRMFKEIDYDTGRTLQPEGAKGTPLYQIIQMYVDFLVDKPLADFKERYGLIPMAEPLIGKIFDNKENQRRCLFHDFQVPVPRPDLQIAMKVKSAPNRDKEDKLIKDLADTVALILYSDDNRLDNLSKWISEEGRKEFEGVIDDKNTVKVANILDIDEALVRNTLRRIRV